ncbi:uncharacterized protein LOC113291608 [Papaver somniferum]|uniref:uncharacterized protein LOC113291608 n=1 Tax=Papaver somniferum TaxID=3469 RepID=UPI000E706057|nr:uncharacterized protein LOC113291608 [Papaver somniferum]
MSLSKVNFKILDISGKNYLSWVLYAEVHLGASSLDNTITKDNNESQEDRSKTLIFICHHLDEALKSQYLTVKDPYTLWTELKDRFEHQKTVILPRSRYEWMHLLLQDFKSVSEYNSTLFQIVSRLKLCGEIITDVDLLEKTYSTFHASKFCFNNNIVKVSLKKHSELISCLLVAEQNNELLLKNHQIHPAGSTVAPEMNATEIRGNAPESRGKGHRRWLGPKNPNNKKKAGHWANVCRTGRHLVDLYQASIKQKEKKAETNFSQYDIPMDIAHLDISDFKNDGNEIEDMDSFLKDI